MLITIDKLDQIAGTTVDRDNAGSVLMALDQFGDQYGIMAPHRLAQFLAQVMHESGRFKYDREIWGPTAAQARYDTRTDLGNTPEVDGDGKKNAGRGPMQVTGGYNIAQFKQWCIEQHMSPPDFVADPDLINTDPWEALSAIWFWHTRKLNELADSGNIEQITKKINGGLNGFSDRVALYARAALVLLDYAPDDLRAFQSFAQTKGWLPPDEPGKTQVDGDPGPLTRSALHRALSALSPDVETKSAPVTQDVVVTPKGADKRGWQVPTGVGSVLVWLGTQFAAVPWQWKVGAGAVVVVAVIALLWRGEVIIQRFKALRKEVEGS